MKLMKSVFWIMAVMSGYIASAQISPGSSDKNDKKDKSEWTFVVSGDSRNCGNVVMPAIAAGAEKNGAAFYWHLGDLRAIYTTDEDYQHEPEHRGNPVDKDAYLKDAWDDFIQNQLAAFGSTPVFVGIGNHETTRPKTREQFVVQFTKWLDAPVLHKQRQADGQQDSGPKAYFHWVQGGVDFIYLDDATHDQFAPDQVSWFEGVLQRDASNPEVRAVVVGMHAALPDSLASGHSMSDWSVGLESGRRVYNDLWSFQQKTKKHVYTLASHSHFYMSGIFDSDYWRANGGVLPGWIVGTAGAVRYALPPNAARAKEAQTKIYGFLLAKVHADGTIDFQFHEIKQKDIPAAVKQRYTPEFVGFCFDQNTNFDNASATAH
jgi:hypothetical protein